MRAQQGSQLLNWEVAWPGPRLSPPACELGELSQRGELSSSCPTGWAECSPWGREPHRLHHTLFLAPAGVSGLLALQG